jgi:hypothetical protein
MWVRIQKTSTSKDVGYSSTNSTLKHVGSSSKKPTVQACG